MFTNEIYLTWNERSILYNANALQVDDSDIFYFSFHIVDKQLRHFSDCLSISNELDQSKQCLTYK